MSTELDAELNRLRTLRTSQLWVTELRLMYLKVADDLTHSPTAGELERFEGELADLWASIVRDGEHGDFRPKKSKLCVWCSFQELCPAFGGTPPEYPGWPGAHGQ